MCEALCFDIVIALLAMYLTFLRADYRKSYPNIESTP